MLSAKMMTHMNLPGEVLLRVVAIVLLRPEDAPNALALLADFSAALDTAHDPTTVAIVGCRELLNPMIQTAVDDFEQCKTNTKINFATVCTDEASPQISRKYSRAVEICVEEFQSASSVLIVNAGTRLINDDDSAKTLLAKVLHPAESLHSGLVVAQLENKTQYQQTYALKEGMGFAPPFAIGQGFLYWLATATHLRLQRANCYTLTGFLEDLARVSGHRVVYVFVGNVAHARVLVSEIMTPTAIPVSRTTTITASASLRRASSSTSALHTRSAKYVGINTFHGLVWHSTNVMFDSNKSISRSTSFDTIALC